MSKKYILLGVLLLVAVPTWAQDDVEKVNVFVGYSYLRGDFGRLHGDVVGGGVVSGAYNVNKYFAAVGEWSTHHDSDVKGMNVDNNLFLGGPRFTFLRTKRLTAFSQALFGFHHTQIGLPGTGLRGDDDTGFAFAGGVGFDVNLSKHWAIRTQVDYVTLDLELPPVGINQSTDNIRTSGGIVFRWGG
jgi:opacity protein-like surface antigen